MGDLLRNLEPPLDEGESRPPPGDVIDPWDLLGNLPVPAAAHDLGGDASVRFVNAAFIKTFGYTLEDIPTADVWAERAYPDPAERAKTMERWWAEIEKRQQTGQIAAPREYRVHDKAGRLLDVLIGFTIHGNLVIITMQDVTDIRATESALEAEKRKNEITAHALTENMPAGAYTMVLAPGEDMAKFAFLSKRFLDMLDLTHDEAVGDPATGFSRVHPEDRPGWLAANAQAFRRRAPFSREARVVVRGETRWIRAESVPRALADGSIVWEGILVDITSHKEAEQQLTAVLEAARAYTWRRDLGAGRSEFDANWGHLAGHAEGVRDMPSEEWILTVHPEDRERVRAAVRSLEAGEVERAILTYRRQIRDDRWIWLQVHAGVSERGVDGRPTALSGVSFDISDEVARLGQEQEKQAELREELQRAQQRDTMAQVAGGIAHDLNNLIGLVQWTVDALEPVCQGQEESAESLATIRKAVDMALDLTKGAWPAVAAGNAARPA